MTGRRSSFSLAIALPCCLAAMSQSATGCGDNDFRAREAGAQAQADEMDVAGARPPGVAPAAEPTLPSRPGLLLTVRNAMLWPTGAEGVPTQCHLNASLCSPWAAQPPDVDASGGEAGATPPARAETGVRPCVDMLRTVNASASETFFLPAARAAALAAGTGRLSLQLVSSCQTVAGAFGIGHDLELDAGLAEVVQRTEVTITRARPWGYDSEVHTETGSPTPAP